MEVVGDIFVNDGVTGIYDGGTRRPRSVKPEIGSLQNEAIEKRKWKKNEQRCSDRETFVVIDLLCPPAARQHSVACCDSISVILPLPSDSMSVIIFSAATFLGYKTSSVSPSSPH